MGHVSPTMLLPDDFVIPTSVFSVLVLSVVLPVPVLTGLPDPSVTGAPDPD